MGCVNKASKEFKDLAARHDVAENALELITHKYWLETGNETLFPTDVYIQAQLGNTFYKESGKNVRMLWDKAYSSPKEFTSMGALQVAYREAEKYFPKSALVHYQNAKGNFVLSVKKPVESVNYTKDDFFDDEDSFKSARNAKTLDLGLKDKKVYGIDKVKELYDRFNTDRTSKDLAERVFKIANELNLKVSFNENLPFGTLGRYQNNNTITYKKSFFERDVRNNTKAPILLHEILHAVSMYALSDSTKNWERSKDIENFKNEMTSVFQDLKDNPILKGERGIVDVKEFVAELANPVFRAKIQEIDKQNKEKKTFWSRILDAFKSLLGLHVTHSYYQRSINALDKALNSFDMDSYMRYNGIKNLLRLGYNAKDWDFRTLPDDKLKKEVNEYIDKKSASENNSSVLTELKPQYRGKLIYAQSGTGKSTIADNKTVFDSDYILGNILGVSTETAGFFFKTLSAKQKKAFGEQYRETIKQMVADGYTVLTANESLLNDADVVIYNQSAQQTDERVNGNNRALTNKYHAPEYHQNTLAKIKKLKDEDKENPGKYVELDGKHYLSDVISSGNNLYDRTSNLRTDSEQKKSNAILEEQQRDHVISSFLNEFGISVNMLDNYDGELPLFDALNKVINARTKADITEGVGYAIAFMMQSDPEMQRMIVSSHGMTGDYNKKIPIINKKIKSLHPNQHSPVAKEVLREIGRQITSELKDSFGTPIEEVKSKKTIWKVIKNFFTKIGMRVAALGKRNKVLKQENLFVKDIIEALGREDFSRIKGPNIKEDTTELAQRVYVEQALKDNPFEDNIIRKLGEHGIALAGSTSIALQGSLFRPSENPLHDIDFNAGDNSSKESLDKLLPTIFPNGTIQFSHSLPKDKKGNQTVTYILLSEPFTIKKTGYDTAEFYSKDGRYLGKRVHYDLFLEDGVQGKMLDFFTGPTQESNHGFYRRTINGHTYLISESNAAMAAKIKWARPKDMWDYKRFIKDTFKATDFIQSLPAKDLKDELRLIEQEDADYDLVNGVEKKKKSFNFDFEKPKTQMEKDLEAIKTNDWNLPEEVRTKVEKKLEKYIASKSGEVQQDVDVSPYFGKDNKTTAKNVLEYIIENSTDREIKDMAQYVFDNLGKNTDVPVEFFQHRSRGKGSKGTYYASTHSIEIDARSLVGSNAKEALNHMEGTIIHEIAHAITTRAMNSDPAARKEILEVFSEYTKLSSQYGITLGYAAKNPKEFVAEFLGNKAFREALMELPSSTQKVTLGQKILNFIKRILGIPVKNTFFDRTDDAILRLMDYANAREWDSTQSEDEDMSTPQTFTFADGTTVRAPFKPNAQQIDALNEMDKFIKSDETSMTLSGYAGTGKTSIMQMLAEKAKKQHRRVEFCASTNKAAAVLNDKVSKSGFQASTLNKLFGIAVEVDPNSKSYNAKNLVNSIKDNDLFVGTTVIIDEASMINEENYNILKDIAENNHLKLIFVGDEAQLAPVNEDKISKVFRNGDGKVIRLTQVERTDDNAILKEATDLRDDKPLSGVSSFNTKGEGVAYITPQHQEAVDEVVEHFVKGLKKDPNHFRILAYTNKAVAKYNGQVRNLLGYTTPVPQVGEPMMGYSNWGYTWDYRTKKGYYKLLNSESYKVMSVGKPIKVTHSVNGIPIVMEAVPVTLEDSLGKRDTFNYMDIKSNPQNRHNAEILANEKNRLWKETKRKGIGRDVRIALYNKINDIEKFLFVNDSVTGNEGNVLQSKVIDFGYAMTVHKSQGSTFTNVLVDDVDISRAGLNTKSNQNYSEAISLEEETTNIPSEDNLNSMSEVIDLGDLSGVSTEESSGTKAPEQASKLIQQLEYVAVSRATDTVTIISNDVKKEGFPLHYIKDTKNAENFQGATTILPKFRGAMSFSYGNAKRADVKSSTTLNAIKAGERTATTRYTKDGNISYWKQVKVGDIIEFHNNKGEKVYVEVVKPLTLLPQNTSAEAWSQKEGWSTAYFDKNVKPEIEKGEAYQMEYKYLGDNLNTINSKENTIDAATQTVQSTPIEYKKDGEVSIEYTPTGKETQTYTIKGNQIFNKDGKEVFKEDSVDRNKIFANLAVQQGRAVVVEHNNRKYVVNNRSQIISGTTGKLLQWRNDNGDRRAIIKAAGEKFKEKGVKVAMEKSVQEAHKDVLNTLGNDEQAQVEIQSTLATAVMGIALEKALDAVNPIFTKKEQEQIKKALGEDKKLQVMSVSRMTDPVFFTKEIINFLAENAKKPFTDASRVNAIEIWSKHDGIPMQELLKACKKYKVAPMVSFSITGLGDTTLERGVMKYNDLLDRIEKYIKAGDLNPSTTTVRIDPILIGETNLEDIKAIVNRAKSMGIKKFVSSLVQTYGYLDGTPRDRKVTSGINTAMEREHRTYDWDKYYGRITQEDFAASEAFVNRYRINHPRASWLEMVSAGAAEGVRVVSRSSIGKIHFIPKQEYIEEIGKVLLEINKDPEIELETCSFVIKGLRASACLDPLILERITGVDVTDPNGRYKRDTSRPDCMCYGAHSDMFRMNEKKCFSSCAYCYAGKSDSSAISYYNEDGSLKDTIYTRTEDFSDVFQTPNTSRVETEDVMKPWKKDASKANKTRRIYLKGQKDKGYFEVVKDLEDNNYSIHFKPTDSKNPNAFTEEEKNILFQAAADIIPEGANLSTWGELSKGGIHGLNRFLDLGFVKTGDRNVKMKTGEDVNIPILTKSSEASMDNLSSKTVSLPGYEKLNGLYGDTPVDAEWKIPYLKELDAQISGEKSEEENNNIINKMNTILQATSEKEYQQETQDPKKAETQNILNEYDKLLKQFDNLLDNEDGLTASEIRHIAELVGNDLSDMITDLQKEKGLAKEQFPSLKTDLDFQSASRRKVAETVDINRLIDRCKKLFSTEVVDYDDVDQMLQADVIIDNFDAIMHLAADVFALNEGFGIVKDYKTGKYKLTKQPPRIDYDNFHDYSNDEDIAAENGEKDGQEHWQVESRTIDVLTSMSALVRQGLHDCYLLDENGNKIYSRWQIAERVNPRDAVNSILRWTQGSQSLKDMVSKLSQKQKKTPWLSQLITRLSDTSGKETDFQSQFYGVMSKHFQSYSIIVLEDGKYHNVPVNNHPALSEAMKTITAQFKMGELPLFGDNGKINAKVLGNDNTIGENSDFNFHKALAELQTIRTVIDHGNSLEEKDMETASANIMGICRNFGYNVTEDMVSEILDADNIRYMTEKLGFLVKDLDKALKDQKNGDLKVYDPFKFKGKYAIDTTLKNFLTPITEVLEDTAINAFYDSGKMYQSYVIPSYWSMLMNKFNLNGQQFEDFIRENYASSEWFRDKKAGIDLQKGWRNEWLRRLATDENARKIFSHKVELNFNKHNYMRNMTDAEYTVSMIAEYFAENTNIAEDQAPSWYRVPMQSNKPSSEYIRFYSYRGDKYKDSIVYGLTKMFLQELSRIQTVRMRNLSKEDPEFIKNFDSNGRKFCLLPVFNNYLEDSRIAEEGRTVLKNEDGSISSDNNLFARLLQKKIKGEMPLTEDEDTKFSILTDKIIRNSVEDRVQKILSEWEENGIIEAAKAIKGIYPTELDDAAATRWTKEQIENFLWNDTFASKNILQLTITDAAFYKDAEDLQKRLAQLHAPGIRANVEATDYEGNLVSDGKYRTFIIKDYDDFISNIIDNLNVVFDRKIAAAQGKEKEVLIELKDSLTRPRTYNEDGTVKDKGGKYWNINVTDAQGYSSPTSYRKKAFMFGKWSRQAERIYQKLLKGTYNYTDLETAFQPLKPFVYAKLHKNLGVDKAPITSMPIPFQAKNAEYLLIMADAILQGEKELSKPNLLRAIYRIMEDSAYDGRERDSKGNIVKEGTYNGKGIDTVQFESAIKSSLQGAMDIHQFLDMQEGEEAAYTFMKNQIYKEKYRNSQLEPGKKERVYDEYNTDVFVHETSFDHYCLQQEVPEHFKEHSQAHGSQIRMITPSDLDFYTTDENGKQVTNYYTWKEPDGTVRKVTAEEYRKEYEDTIAANIRESIDVLRAELHLNIKPDSSYEDIRKEQNIALAKILQSEILASPRYGVDLLQACSIDKETGEFRIPKGDPVQAKRIEQLINSIIKNRINKQEIAGGPIVQVSNFGTSKQLHIRFSDKKGNLIPLEEEYKASEHGGLSYKEYLKKNQGGIAYFEVYIPIWSNDIFKKFANPDGTINIEAIEATDPELLKMISYRIPTEDKYSCAPMKAVGFMPKEAGDAIMFPFELTEIDDSDFDVDKRYVMRKDIPILEKDPREFLDDLVERGNDLYKNIMGQEAADGYVRRMVGSILKKPMKFLTNSPFRKALFSEYQKVAYYTEAPVSGRKYRDNKIVDMTFAVLTNEMTADKILNPGGFDGPKKMGYLVTAYKNPVVREKGYTWEDLQKMSTDDLKKLSYTDKDLTYADTQVQFYKQNSAAASLIGVFAVNKVAHATLESNDIWLDVAELCGEDAFNIAGHYEIDEKTGEKKIVGGMTFKDRMQIDVRYDIAGNLIGKTLGSLVSASADAVKDPILNLMNINMTTAGMLNTMLRLGMTFEDASLFLSQDIIGRLLNQFNRENLTNYVSLSELIDKWISKYKENNKIIDSSKINTEALTKEELIEGITPEKHGEIDYKVLLAFKKLQLLTDAMRKPTFATRFNSISSAVGPLILDNLIQESKRDSFLAENGDTHFYTTDGREIDINDIFSNHPILEQFSRTLDLAKTLFLDMPSGCTGFRKLLEAVPDDIKNKMYKDKKLFDKFANFYQSYLLIQSGVINQDRLKYYVNEFAKEFNSKKYKEKYPDNELLKEIKLQISKSGKPYLQIKITGMDEQRKEELRSAWIDLHKADPELSKKLFDYSFFIAGIGFSPKTFMALVPTYVKERLKGKNGASYIDTYRKFPTVMNDVVIDQFICNNWGNNKLVPIKKSEDYNFIIDTDSNTLKVSRENEKDELKNVSYMKLKVADNMYLYKQIGKNDHEDLIYERMQPLGNNGEYLEMHTSKINSPLTAVTKTTEEKENEPSDLKTSSPQETDATSPSTEIVISKSEQKKNISELIDAFMLQNPAFTETSAKEKIEEIKKRGVRKYLKFLQNVFEKKGLHLNLEEVEKEFEKYC